MQTVTIGHSALLDGRGPKGIHSFTVKIAYHWHETWTDTSYVYARDIPFGIVPDDMSVIVVVANVDMEFAAAGTGFPATIAAGIPFIWHTDMAGYYDNPITAMTDTYLRFRNTTADITKEAEVIMGFNPDIGV